MFGLSDVQSYYVQFLDNSGWRNCMAMSASASPERMQIAMCEAQRSYPGYRIRIVDEAGRLIDML